MIQPKSRNWAAYLEENFSWAHGLSSGGAGVVSDEGKKTYPDGRRNFCGDAWDEYKWDAPRSPVITYRPGQVINVDTLVAVNHMGRMSVQICQLDAKPGQGKCKNLYWKIKGMDKGVKSWYFPGVDNWGGGNYGGDGPRYGDGTFEAYQLPEITEGSGWGCKGQRLCNQFKGMWVYRTQWMLPQDFTCEHCKLQWTWTTGHSCWPPCEKDNKQPQCENKQMFPTCGEPGAAYPEEFANCADVRITDSAKIDSATNFPPWNWAVTTKSGWWGQIRPSIMHEKDTPAKDDKKSGRK
ncbi:MAG: hypothetical protein J3K34DRAFT_527745 [Monoraphidium minutum]|nr:MAG: hypothetical protein J3K34DRAFT_527745 [Monoraphidium minutum]